MQGGLGLERQGLASLCTRADGRSLRRVALSEGGAQADVHQEVVARGEVAAIAFVGVRFGILPRKPLDNQVVWRPSLLMAPQV